MYTIKSHLVEVSISLVVVFFATSVHAGSTYGTDLLKTNLTDVTNNSPGDLITYTVLGDNKDSQEECVKWKFETSGSVVNSISIGFHNRVHLSCEDGRLYTLSADGVLLWIVDVNCPLLSTPSLDNDGNLYIGGESGEVYAVDPNGRLKWVYRTGGAIYSRPAIGSNGNVYVGSTDGFLYALGQDGSELWQFQTKGPGILSNGSIYASPEFRTHGRAGTVYIGGLYDPNLYALNPNNGSVKWVCNFELYRIYPSYPKYVNPDYANPGGWIFTSPVIAPNGTIYQSLLQNSHLYAIESINGEILWATNMFDLDSRWFDVNDVIEYGASDGWSEPALGPDGTIYVSLDDPYLRAVRPDGSIKWVTRLGDDGAFTLAVDKDGFVYAASDDGYIYVVSPDGMEVARIETGGWPAFPVITEDSVLIVGDSRDYSMFNTDIQNVVWAINLECIQNRSDQIRTVEGARP